MLANAGKQVRIIGNDKEEIYTAVGINPEGGDVYKRQGCKVGGRKCHGS